MINDKAREISATEFSDTKAQINNSMMDLHTSMPAIVMSFDAKTRTVTAQPAIQRVFSEGEGISGAVNLPPCVDVPVVFPSGGGYEITFPVKEGDECLLIFSERCIDSWFTTGEPSEPADYRHHDLSDAFAIVGIKSLPAATEVDLEAMHIGNTDNKISINDESVSVNVGEFNKVVVSKTDITASVGELAKVNISEFRIDASVGENSKVSINAENISLNVGAATMTLNQSSLTSSVDIYCPNLITDTLNTNYHTHGGVENGFGYTGMAE